MSLNTGLYAGIQKNFTEFQAFDTFGNVDYKLYYIQSYDKVEPPYCTFCRHKRIHEIDIMNNETIYEDILTVKMYHTDSLALENLQIKMRNYLESLLFKNVDNVYIQKVCCEDDFHQPFSDVEKGLFYFEGIIEVNFEYTPVTPVTNIFTY